MNAYKSHYLYRARKMACTWFGEIPSCCSLTALLGPVWVLLNYVLQTIFSGPVVLKDLINTVHIEVYKKAV